MTATATIEPHTGRTGWLHRLRLYAQRIVLVLLALLIGALGMRAWMSRSTPDLQPWHRLVPEELDARALDAADWSQYVAAENHLFADVARDMEHAVAPDERAHFNRYNPDSPVYPERFATRWNRSHVLEPEAAAVGVVVLLHGLTDSPYSMRHLAEDYRRRGFIALVPRLPAHGTVPGALTRIEWQDWTAATRMAMREAARRSHGSLPVHLVGYSNGGALAVKYALDALENPALPQVERLVLLSPMIGVNRSARYAGIAGWPAILPPFARTAWLDILPEFNPFKYNSFPVNAARQSYLLTDAVQRQLLRLKASGDLARLPPVLTFQSLVDATVIASAVATAFYAHLPANGSALVLFDINREANLEPFLRQGALVAPSAMLGAAPRNYGVTIVTNAGPRTLEIVARTTAAGASQEIIRPLNLRYPADVFSLSHIALPFPESDGLYGRTPDPAENFGVALGTLGMRGERGVMAGGLDITTVRLGSNPFFAYVIERTAAAASAD
ncbi:MAG TPA: alpha/beta hydrolase [Povalibacter sp.]|uniref:alpha/beta hydrolase n=1 Tax=Povalibacter sp. TaxID=1962978 RepID=UPI002C65008B|nr:alpha/beta hydrolase [Povalibacter sp.]HMN46459.1 alpha/beta hydrolase [Povalibacter sp.]